MDQFINEILEDLYALDNSFKAYENDLKKAIQQLIKAKPDTQFDPAFKQRLRGELLEKIELMKKESTSDAEKAPGFWHSFTSVFSFQTGLRSAAFAAIVLLLLSTVTFFGWNYYEENGGGKIAQLFNLAPKQGETKFELEPTIKDLAGIDPGTSFVLKSSKELSEKQIRKIVNFEPKIEFTVKEIGKISWLIPSALAAEDVSGDFYQYEIKAAEPLKENIVYKVTIKDTTVADREYQWAFQVKAPFSILETTPADKSTFVPTNTLIEIKFNRQLDTNVERYVQVVPKVETEVEVKDDKLYVKPKQLEPPTLSSPFLATKK